MKSTRTLCTCFQERQNEETRRMLRKVLRQLNADKDNERECI